MRTYQLLLIGAGFLFLGCNNQQKDSAPAEVDSSSTSRVEEKDSSAEGQGFLIKGHSAGEFKIGAPIPTSLEDYTISREQQVRTTEEGPTEETVITVSRGNEKILEILPAIDLNTGESTEDIGEMRIFSEQFRTEKGIGVNSTLEEFIQAYPEYKIWYTYVSDMYVVETEEVEAQFLLKAEDFTGEMKVDSVMTPLEKGDFKEGARIAKVRMIE